MSHYLTVVLIEPPSADALALAGVAVELKAAAQEAAPPMGRDVPIRGDKKALRTYAEHRVGELLERYSEDREVEEYETDCWCLETGSAWAREQLDAEGVTELHTATTEDLRGQLRDLDSRIKKAAGGEVDLFMTRVGESAQTAIDIVGENAALVALRDEEQELAKAWRAEHASWDERFESLQKQAPGYGKPDAECETCQGTGRHMTDSNPEGYWDWWVIGGRWAGVFKPEYDPAMDPRNKERCWLCGGTGTRADMRVENGCNGCGGTGVAMRFHNAEFEGDIVPAPEYLELLRGKDGGAPRSSPKRFGIPFALVTPDGEWHSQGRMLMFGTSSDQMTDEQWYSRVVELVEAHDTVMAVACDLHT